MIPDLALKAGLANYSPSLDLFHYETTPRGRPTGVDWHTWVVSGMATSAKTLLSHPLNLFEFSNTGRRSCYKGTEEGGKRRGHAGSCTCSSRPQNSNKHHLCVVTLAHPCYARCICAIDNLPHVLGDVCGLRKLPKAESGPSTGFGIFQGG